MPLVNLKHIHYVIPGGIFLFVFVCHSGRLVIVGVVVVVVVIIGLKAVWQVGRPFWYISVYIYVKALGSFRIIHRI